ncbi:hypothetical protein HYDPIDRAFT_189044 [Hydnomerulius pinastri MD-312]|uniref:F-box domain-containing protein n=1 Tax=Hydnomerulius pinastri MD-312 TaxID=994086 RepID=A0A0C9W6C2_9AGAM|nr:hypothetical protein HYDPIDRAFT_189044 [Hydnomerulius pinastri MD-312]
MTAKRVFSIDELARMICQNLRTPTYRDSGTEWREESQALLHVALCSKIMSEAALDVLWEDSATLGPFLSLLPPTLSKIEDASGVACPPAESWHTFDKYAGRVKRLFLRGFCPRRRGFHDDSPAYVKLATVRYREAGVHLFPRLRLLQMKLFLSGDPFIDSLIPHTVRRLNVELLLLGAAYKGGDQVPLRALQRISICAPLLEQLDLKPDYLLAKQAMPVDFPRLSTVYLRVVPGRVGGDIVKSCHLFANSPIKELVLYTNPIARDFWEDMVPPVFPSLQSFTAHQNPYHSLQLLKKLATKNLQNFTFSHHRWPATTPHLEQCLELVNYLKDRFSASLRSVRINMSNYGTSHAADFAPMLLALNELAFACPTLEEVDVSVPLYQATSVTSMPEEIGRLWRKSSWPRTLKSLRIIHERDGSAQT